MRSLEPSDPPERFEFDDREFELWVARVLRLSRQALDDATARDVVQEALLKLAAKSRCGWEPDGEWRAYFSRTVANLVIDRLRARGKSPASLEDLSPVPVVKAYVDEDYAARVRVCLSRLDARAREAVFLLMLGHDRKRIGAVLDLAEKSVSNRLGKARKTLEKCLGESVDR